MRTTLMQEVVKVFALSLASFRVRWRRSLSALVATAAVIAVFVSVISIARGYQAVVKITEGSDNVMVLMNGANSESVSTLNAEQANLIMQSPLVGVTATGEAAASAELFTTFKIPPKDGGVAKSVSARGVTERAMDLHAVKVVEGRQVMPGKREVIIGRKLMGELGGVKVGDSMRLGSAEWTVVGTFAAGSGLTESEIWADLTTLQALKQQAGNVSVVYLRLAPGATVKTLSKALAADPRVKPNVQSEKDYISSQSDSMGKFVELIGYSTTILMALGAGFASLNSSHSAVMLRSREFATLKALGFRDASILAAVVLESLTLASLAGIATVIVCYAVFDGYTVSSILGSHNYSAVVFSFDVGAGLMAQAVLLAAAIGLGGALYPAFTVLQLPIARALARPH
jgi:putative ABC transport system permease protein